jgi:hypothetical protein
MNEWDILQGMKRLEGHFRSGKEGEAALVIYLYDTESSDRISEVSGRTKKGEDNKVEGGGCFARCCGWAGSGV